MRAEERLLDVDAAIVATARTTAAALDRARSSADVTMVGRVHLAALSMLLAGREPQKDDADAALLAFLRGAEVGDTADA